MSFYKVSTQAEAASYNFRKDQSTILHTQETNEVNINGVNVITATPCKGDVLCITRKKGAGVLLGPDSQDIVWMKGSTINYAEFPDDIFEPVGVVYNVKGRTAAVRYRSEKYFRYSYVDRFVLTGSIMTDNTAHTVDIAYKTTNPSTGADVTPLTTLKSNVTISAEAAGSVKAFTNWLATQLAAATDVDGANSFSAEYVGPHDYDGTDYAGDDGRCIVNCKFKGDVWYAFYIYNHGTTTSLVTASRAIAVDIPANSNNVRKSGKVIRWGGCCFQKFVDWCSASGYTPTSNITNVRSFNDYPVKRTDFNENDWCQLLRDTYGTYENYIREAEMLAWPIGPRSNSSMGLYADKGKEYTAILAAATYKDAANGRANTPVYGPADYCYNVVGVNHTLLGRHCWWLPSSADMMELMEGVTYGTSGSSNLDPVNATIYKLNNNTWDSTKGFRFSPLSASTYRWTSTRYSQTSAYFYNGSGGYIFNSYFYNSLSAAPVTLVGF